MDINNLTLGQLKEICDLLPAAPTTILTGSTGVFETEPHPMLGRRCLIRTYSAGVHIGDVVWINPKNSMELKLTNALRLWKWEGGGLSLSAVARNGIKGGD